MKNCILLLSILVLLLGSCKNENQTSNQEETSKIPTADNSQNALDWEGSYYGVLPCADCEGISTVIRLSKDESYEMTSVYLGKSTAEFIKRGPFYWDETGGIIILKTDDSGPNTYRVGENTLTQLDMDGLRITGELADRYILRKQDGDEPPMSNSERSDISAKRADNPLENKRWVITHVMGKPIKADGYGKGKPFMLLSERDKRAVIYAGCNNMSGGYELEAPNRIRFTPLASTKMGCEDMSLEDAMAQVVQKADSYFLDGKKLQLLKGRMAPLAEFIIEN